MKNFTKRLQNRHQSKNIEVNFLSHNKSLIALKVKTYEILKKNNFSDFISFLLSQRKRNQSILAKYEEENKKSFKHETFPE